MSLAAAERCAAWASAGGRRSSTRWEPRIRTEARSPTSISRYSSCFGRRTSPSSTAGSTNSTASRCTRSRSKSRTSPYGWAAIPAAPCEGRPNTATRGIPRDRPRTTWRSICRTCGSRPRPPAATPTTLLSPSRGRCILPTWASPTPTPSGPVEPCSKAPRGSSTTLSIAASGVYNN